MAYFLLAAQFVCRVFWMLLVSAVFFAAPVSAAKKDEAARVVVVANARDAESGKLAAYYSKIRGIPPENIIELDMPRDETVVWPEFVEKIFNPLLRALTERGWVNATETSLIDVCGRRRYAVVGHKISYLVLMRGVPMRIGENPGWWPAGIGANPGTMRNEASVDGELALLTLDRPPVNGMIPNPLFMGRDKAPVDPAAIIRVTRLDGPTPSDVKRMIESALEGERTGLIGRAYFDIGGPYPQGNEWVKFAAKQFEALGFDMDVDTAGATFGPLARFDSPVFYVGWYTAQPDGPFKQPQMQFAPGAIAVHIYSYSASTLRETRSWCGAFVASGAAATLGNVNEPYLTSTHHLHAFASLLATGRTFGEAAYGSLPFLSWQAIAIGDPLYRPFAVKFDQQWEQRAALKPEQQARVILRKAHMELKAKRSAEALVLAREAFKVAPSVEVGLSLALIAYEAEGKESALRALEFSKSMTLFSPSEVGVVNSIAQLYLKCEKPAKSYDLIRRAVDAGGWEMRTEIALLEAAIEYAKSAQIAAAADLQLRLEKLRASEKKN